MATKANQPQEEKNRDFGLPQAEFNPIEHEENRWLKPTAIIVGIVLLVGAGIVYWFFYRTSPVEPAVEAHAMHEEYENEASKADIDFIDDDTLAINQTPEQDVKQNAQTHEADKELEALEDEEDAKSFSILPAAKPEKGIITTINTPRGHYYVVVGSFIDGDLASDYANQLAQQGVDVMLIEPPQGKYFFRVAIDQEDTFYDANEKTEALKATYGEYIWVMKY